MKLSLMRWSWSSMAALAAAFVVSAAFAVPPPVAEPGIMHGFVEPCTMSSVAERHLECEQCKASRDKACGERLRARGFEKKCRTHGDHTGWDEIWCKAREPEKPSWNATLWLAAGALGTLAAMVLFMRVITRPFDPRASGARPPRDGP
jgi:hypothetical protein